MRDADAIVERFCTRSIVACLNVTAAVKDLSSLLLEIEVSAWDNVVRRLQLQEAPRIHG